MSTPQTGSALAPETLVAQALHRPDIGTAALVPALQPSTTFLRGADNKLLGLHEYRRPEGPSERLAAEIVTALEGGAAGRLFGSGLAAAAAVFDTVAAGGTVLAQAQMYYGLKKLLQHLAEKGRLRVAFFDPSDPDSLPRLAHELRPELIWIETPANPSWAVVDIARAAGIARKTGAVLAVDGTCAPPCTTRALDLGGDLVMHSATKYLNGHSDVLAGVVVTREADARWTRLTDGHKLTGAVAGALESWLLIRGLRTLFVRFERQSANALAVARALEGHPRVLEVLYEANV